MSVVLLSCRSSFSLVSSHWFVRTFAPTQTKRKLHRQSQNFHFSVRWNLVLDTGPVGTYAEKIWTENTALFLRLGLTYTLTRHENGAFLKTMTSRQSRDFLAPVFLKHKSKMSGDCAFSNFSDVAWTENIWCVFTLLRPSVLTENSCSSPVQGDIMRIQFMTNIYSDQAWSRTKAFRGSEYDILSKFGSSELWLLFFLMSKMQNYCYNQKGPLFPSMLILTWYPTYQDVFLVSEKSRFWNLHKKLVKARDYTSSKDAKTTPKLVTVPYNLFENGHQWNLATFRTKNASKLVFSIFSNFSQTIIKKKK